MPTCPSKQGSLCTVKLREIAGFQQNYKPPRNSFYDLKSEEVISHSDMVEGVGYKYLQYLNKFC